MKLFNYKNCIQLFVYLLFYQNLFAQILPVDSLSNKIVFEEIIKIDSNNSTNINVDVEQWIIKNFGKEKRLSPEQTLLYENSDCEDRAAFFFYLVKEIYDLPMIVLSYPEHITIAVQFSKSVGNPIYYKGNEYSICEATPQRQDLKLGQSIPHLKKVPFDVVYEYRPQK